MNLNYFRVDSPNVVTIKRWKIPSSSLHVVPDLFVYHILGGLMRQFVSGTCNLQQVQIVEWTVVAKTIILNNGTLAVFIQSGSKYSNKVGFERPVYLKHLHVLWPQVITYICQLVRLYFNNVKINVCPSVIYF